MPFARFFSRLVWTGLVPALLTVPALAQNAPPIVYNYIEITPTSASVKLAAINPDGTGDQFVPLALSNPYYPAWSRDGQAIAVAAGDPARPNKVSTDAWVWRPGTGAITKIAAFEDFASASGFLTFYPSYLAFSPDGKKVAAGMVAYSGARSTTTFTNEFGNPYGPYQVSSKISRCVSLAVFDATGVTAPFYVASGLCDDDSGNPGEGVDWSPTQDVIAYPYNTPTAFSGPGGAVFPLTAIHLIEPTAGAADQGRRRQLTFPGGNVGQAFDPVTLTYTSDYGPAFSPNGQQVAYIRGLTQILNGGAKQALIPSIRMVNVDGSNDHEVVPFQKGSYLTRITWSPDGQKLVFDLANQATRDGFPLGLFDVNTVGLASIGANGQGFAYLRGARATWPTWRPNVVIVDPGVPALSAKASAGGGSIVFTWPAPGNDLVLERSAQIGTQAQWSTVAEAVTTAGNQRTATVSTTGGQSWFRLRHP